MYRCIVFFRYAICDVVPRRVSHLYARMDSRCDSRVLFVNKLFDKLNKKF